jgi:metal-sulfur cluster biosynthetic enzyme
MSDANDNIVERVREALREVIDPEIGFNIVDIGLIYDVAIEEGGIARVTMTTTTMGCPATNYLRDGAGEAAQSVDGVQWADVRLTYDPPWTPDMMSPVAKEYLGVGG